ncbi:MAG TPA: hypothetical protein DET40_21645 [Lentisphaeria bacterium]|nr:hypothetical protein [Lentisphaeria bacterium]
MKRLIAISLILLLSGCASTDIYDGNGKLLYHLEGRGFGRDLGGCIEKNADGSEKVTFTCASNVASIMGAINDFAGILIAGAGNLK